MVGENFRETPIGAPAASPFTTVEGYLVGP